MYTELMPLADRHPQRRRGLLMVARADLRQAMLDYPGLSAEPEILGVLKSMTDMIESSPSVPTLRAVDALGSV